MAVDYNNKYKNKGFSFKNEILKNLFFEQDEFLFRPSSLSDFERVQLECNATDILQKFLDFCNINVFWNFKLELKMVE
jgi:hypothetical protein